MKRTTRLLTQGTLAILLLAIAGAKGAQLPPSKGAPKVGEKAPEFTLPDTMGKPAKLSELLSSLKPSDTAGGKKSPYLLLVFYRGYW